MIILELSFEKKREKMHTLYNNCVQINPAEQK